LRLVVARELEALRVTLAGSVLLALLLTSAVNQPSNMDLVGPIDSAVFPLYGPR
jgi:hypothetical protein